MSFSVLVNGAVGVDPARGSSGPRRGKDFAVVAGDGGADFGLDVLRKISDKSMSTLSAGRGIGGSQRIAGRCSVAGSDSHPDCFRLPNNDFTASTRLPSSRGNTSKS